MPKSNYQTTTCVVTKNLLKSINLFLEKYKILVIIICTFSNLALFIMIAGKILGNKETMAWASFTGPFGDTMGGILSPMTGIISIYLIYKTFQTQNEQLTDQQKANSLASDAFYFSQGKMLLDEVFAKFSKITYTPTYFIYKDQNTIFAGALAFVKLTGVISEKELDINEREFLNKISEEFKKILITNELSGNIMNNALKKTYKTYLYEYMGESLIHILNIHSILQEIVIKYFQETRENSDRTITKQAIVDTFIDYDNFIRKFSEVADFIMTYPTPDPNPYSHFYEKMSKKRYFNELYKQNEKKFGKINLTKKWRVTPLAFE